MCPEVFQYNGPRPTTAIDMFSYGVLAWCALHVCDTLGLLACTHELLPLHSSSATCKHPRATIRRLAFEPAMRLWLGLHRGSAKHGKH